MFINQVTKFLFCIQSLQIILNLFLTNCNFMVMKPGIIITLISFLFLLSACQSNRESYVVQFTGELSEHKWAFKDLDADLPSDWSSYNYLTLELNASSTQRFLLKIFDRQGIRLIQIHPFQNTWVKASVPLIHFQKRNVVGMDMAAIGKRPLPGLCIGFTGAVGTILSVMNLHGQAGK